MLLRRENQGWKEKRMNGLIVLSLRTRSVVGISRKSKH
jgi:hypothetical protein